MASSVGDQELDNGSAHYFVSSDGHLVYRTRGQDSGATRSAYLDLATGGRTPFGAEAMHTSQCLSPDNA